MDDDDHYPTILLQSKDEAVLMRSSLRMSIPRQVCFLKEDEEEGEEKEEEDIFLLIIFFTFNLNDSRDGKNGYFNR